ncbi:hypothetical protein GF339_12560, partial [candidate division KSB3 bacterium]|nr:hypothetical protein [candidate division KSB3 bacterium]MBD3325414.1 hypothetical protein [candidate division KSB3 bacterium]
MKKSDRISGNILGGSRAEIDKTMLAKAFVETHDFQALVNTTDFNFVVGRRGTGKSALFLKIFEYIKKNKTGYIYENTPQEYEQLALRATVERITSNYRSIRAITRVAWRVSILLDQLSHIQEHYKFKNSTKFDYLCEVSTKYEELLSVNIFSRTASIISECFSEDKSADEVPAQIAIKYDIEALHFAVNDSLLTIGRASYYLFDGLDEGWQPNKIATAVLG